MWSSLGLWSLAALLVPSHALYFYIDGPTQKCFFEGNVAAMGPRG